MISQPNNQTGYPSIDKPWMRYYDNKYLDNSLPEDTIYNYLWKCSKESLDDVAIQYYGKKNYIFKVV